MVAQNPKLYTGSYEPTQFEAGGLQRFVWLFSATGRARRALWRAMQAPDDPERRMAVARSLKKLASLRSRHDAKACAVACETLCYLTWAATCSGDLSQACSCLSELDKDFPKAQERVALRWALLCKIDSEPDADLYLPQASAFVSDPLVKVENPTAAVLEIVRVCYERLSEDACAKVIASAQTRFAKLSQFRSALALCKSPKPLRKQKDIDGAHASINPDDLHFSPIMRADALVIAARSAEYSGDYARMVTLARSAHEPAPEREQTLYWLTRAQLYDPESKPIGADDIRDRAGKGWVRLANLIDLRGRPGLDQAAAVLSEFGLSRDAADLAEARLTGMLLAPALSSRPSWTADDILRCASLCEDALRSLGDLPWAHVGIALKQVLIDRDYAGAVRRLTSAVTSTDAFAVDLARIARILGGLQPAKAAPAGPLAAVETAIVRLAARCVPDDLAAVRSALLAARGDAVCIDFPLLGTAIDVLGFAYAVLCREQSEPPALPPGSPDWVVWLNTRASLINGEGEPALAGAMDNPACVWVLNAWWSAYGVPGADPPDSLVRAVNALEEPFSALGDLFQQIAASDADAERSFAEAMLQSASGASSHTASDPAAVLGRTIAKLDTAPFAVSEWWRPAMAYRQAALLARTEPQSARQILEGLLGGPKSSEARAQLAMLRLSDSDLKGADELLGGITRAFPAAVYARALLQSRQGSVDSARETLDTFERSFGFATQPYGPAARRLVAAIEERQGSAGEAERLNAAIVAEDPGDAVAVARLVRIQLRDTYSTLLTGQDAPADDLDALAELAGKVSHGPGWGTKYALLCSILARPKSELRALCNQTSHTCGMAKPPFRQVAVRRLLGENEPAEARLVSGMSDEADAPAWRERTRLILDAWDLLASLWRQYKTPDQNAVEQQVDRLRKQSNGPSGDRPDLWAAAEAAVRAKALEECVSKDCLDRIPELAGKLSELAACDDTAARWQFLLLEALRLAEPGQAVLDSDSWASLRPWPVAGLPGLWSADPKQREAACAGLAAAVDDGCVQWRKPQRQVIRALIAAAGHEDQYLEDFLQLEPKLEQLPVAGSSLWLRAAQIWFARKNWARLLDSSLPECVADLADPRVRLLLSFAYARCAADGCTADVRKAAQRVRQARAALEPLLGQAS